MELSDFSRFRKTPKTIIDGVETYGKWVEFSFLKERPSDDQIGIFRVTSGTEGKPHNISNIIYGTPLLDWVLIAFNDARDVLNWPKAGTIVFYPLDSIVFPQIL